MKRIRLQKENAVYTTSSETTILVNYSKKGHILEVEYHGGGVYHYSPVPNKVWEEYKRVIESGGSSGTFVNTYIKPHFKYKRL